MDSIAFAFCDAVVGTIKDLPRLHVAFPDAKWNKSLQDHSANRQCFRLFVDFYDGKWSYCLFNRKFGSNALLTTLLAQVGPKYLRICYIECVGYVGWFGIETLKEELHVLIKNVKPFVNFPLLKLYDVNSKIPESYLDQILSVFTKVNICTFFSSSNGRCAIEFAKQLMQQDTLVKTIQIQGAEDALAAAIVDYRATGRVVHVNTERLSDGANRTSLRFVR